MPTKEYIQLLQRLYVYLKRNSGRNVPHGISQITLIDDDDLTRWFVQLLYKDENNADFYVSLELVFNEDVDSEDSVAGGAWGVSAGVGGAGSRHRRPSRHMEPSASATTLAAADAAPQSAAATSSPHVHRHDTTATSSPAPPTQPSSSLTSSGAGDKVRATAERVGGREVAPRAVASSRDGSNGARTSDRSTQQQQQQQQSDDDANSVPTATTPQPYNDFQCRLVALGEARRPPLTSEGHMALPENADGAGVAVPQVNDPSQPLARPQTSAFASPPPPTAATGGSRRRARMPLVFVVAPRLIASFIHHGALCSLELMSQDWELTPENMVLLLIALFETLNPFAGDGRVSVDDAERMEHLRETVAAWGVDGGGSSALAAAYSEEEHQLGMEYIRRAHPHLFRRYVGPLSESASAARDGMPSLPVSSESRGGLSASANPNIAAAAATGGGMVQRNHRDMYFDSGSAVTATGSDSVRPSASPHSAQTATTTPSLMGFGTGHGRGSSGALAPHVLRDVSHLNTAVYDALVATYAPPSEPSPVSPPPPLCPTLGQQQPRPTAATAKPVVMLLDSPALLADAEGVRLFQSGVRGVQQAVVSTTAAGEDKYSAADSTTPDTPADRDRVGASPKYSGSAFPSLPAPLQQRTPSTRTATPPPSSSASTSVFAPVMNAERVLRARPPALWHVAYAPTHPHTAASCGKVQLLQQRVAELWIPFTLLPPPPSISGSSTAVSGIPATSSAEESQVTQVLRLAEAGVSCERGAADSAAAPLPLEVHLIGDAGDNVQEARVACVLRNVRVSATAARKFSSTVNPLLNASNGGSPSTTQRTSLRFSLQSSTAPSPAGDVHTCHLPRGLTLHCRNMYLYGHLRVFGNLVLDSCVFVGSLTTEELASVQVSRSHLALMPDDRLLLRQPPYRRGPSDRCRGAGRGAPRQRASSTASPGAADAARPPPPPPPPPPALFYAQRKECVLVLDSSRVEMSEDTHVYRLMPNFHAAAAAAATRGWQRSTQEAETEKRSGEPSSASCDRDEDEGSDEVASVRDNGEDSGDEGKAAAAAVAPSLAAMMAVLRSLILVSNQARLRLVRCTIHPGRNTERTVFAEQNAIVDMAHCTVTAAISSAVSVQGCRAYLEHCFFEGSPTTTAAATSAVLSAEAAAQEAVADGVGTESDHDTASDRSEIQQQPPPPIHVNDTTRCTGLNVELGGTLTARYCAARHLYFAFCVIAHSVAHFYRCHAEDVVNGFTVDASAATLDGCSADTNHVGAFVLRKAKCILTDDSGGSFPRRCTLLGEAHETACRAVTEALRQQHQETRGGGVGPPAITETESLWTSAAAVAERTARVALLARRHYAEQLPRSDTLSDAAPVTTTATHAPHRRSQTAIGMSSPQQTLGFFGGRFSLEVRDAALKATGVMLMNAHDTSVYAYENSAVELEECVLWSTAEAEEAASAAAATVAAALGSAESSAAAASAAALKLTGRRALTGADGTFDGQLRSGSPRQRSCGVKVVHASLKARRCLMAGYSFGLAAIQSAQAELQECLVVNAINGYTIDHSQCRLRHCGADTSHVGLFALNGSRVEAESTPHVVGVSSCGRTPPPLICGGVPAVFCGDVYGVEIQSSEVECTGITVLRGRDSGFNAYNGSTLRLSKCLVDMSPTDAASYVFRRPSSGGAAGVAAAVGEVHAKRHGSSTNKGDAAGMAGLWIHHLHLDVSDAVHAHSRNRLLAEQQGDTVPHRDEGGEDGRGKAMRAAAPAATTTPTTATPPLAPSSAGRVAPAVRTSGVKVWSGSQCHAQDTEVRCVTFGFASLGPETLLDAHHCTAKHVVNGFTSDGGALQLTKCSASSNHVGVYVLSHARCVVRRGSYTAKKYGIECRSGVLSLQGHVKIYGFSRIGMYLYDGAHCEADSDCVLDIHALKHASPGSSADVTPAVVPAAGSGIRSPSLLQLSKTQQPQPPMSTASTTSLCSPEDAVNVSDLLPACIALDEATAHLPQAVLGGGARCGVTCGDGATGFIGKCIVYDCSLVGVNVFYGAHLTLANALLRCAQQYAVVVHVGGVCRIIQNAEGDETGDDDDGLAVDSTDEGVDRGARGSGGLGSILRRHGPGAAASAAVRRLRRLASHIVAVPWRVAHQWAGRRDPDDGAAAAESVAEDSSGCGAVLSGARARSLATGSMPGAPPTPRHPPSRVADKVQHLSSDTSSRWRGETRSAVSPSSATAATASLVAIGGGGGAILVRDDDDEVGGRRTLPLTSALRRRLKWLCWKTYLGAPLPFRLSTLTMPVATVGANGTGPEPGSTAAGVAECQSFSLSPSASGAAAPTSGAPAITSVFPPVRPTICGSCVVRGTCTMERVVLRPTNHLPRLFAECSRADRARNSGKEHDDEATTATATDDEDGAMDTARDSAGNVAALRPRRSPWPGQEVCNSPAQHRHTDSNNSADDTTSTGEQGGDSAYASPLLTTAATIKTSLAAGHAVAAASARAADGWAALPSACVLHHLVRQPPGVHVCQQGVLNLTDCIVDASLSPQPYLGARHAGQIVSAVVACEGPYAKLHCDYVRVVRGESGDEDGRTAIEGGDGGASSAPRPVTFPALTRSSALPALSPDAAPPLLAAADVATVPLLLVSLVDGAQCTLHMVGASLDDWPYGAYSAESINHDGNVCSDPMTGAEKEDAGNPLGFAGRGGAAAAQLSPARLISARNAGVMLRTTGDTLAEVTYASIAGIVASQRSQVWLAHCTVTGTVPIILGSGSYSSLTCCRVVGGARAGPAAAAIRVEDDGDLTLIRSSVWTLSQGLAVECVDSGCVHAVDSEELTLGRVAGSADGHGDCEEAIDGAVRQP
ncbi:conserved hypothetical protein [Leishmania major strain Friedlin]|uniref:Uncharacterized protein n=1 Tax=Leishmania major TaxID=5664 RepID=E9ACL5_LEIMA|nr:conserved hypothetical protein [Leishmania major strain Friedlin]CAG9567296.1 hypothetical_protein_-_conserved [Leishmania major strain Friedlin]CBZ12032.1 conserved hypothetical protein [Leishmania major strain Friedlin]|eukprot:XP_003721746.1 conserved hypothetical protein [Leishmania major strain Friedlin]